VTGTTLWRVETDPGEGRVLPDGVMDLMWFDGRLVIAGADTTATVTVAGHRGLTWGLRLPPGTAHAVLGGVRACELADRRVDLSDLAEVPTSILDSVPEDPAAALERVFTTLWARADPERPALRLAASLDRAARAGLSVRDIAARHELPERTLRRLSDTLFGYGPKTLASIYRFQHALSLARAGTPLAEAAAAAGYADQSHLNREVRRLAGTRPTMLLG
jgi:AraC-like DNA-binding protein